MNKETTEQKKLTIARVIGWLNFLCFAYLFVMLKVASEAHLVFLVLTALISIIGTIAYYFYWEKLFHTVERKNAIKYVKPYRLGVMLLVSGAIFIMVLLSIER